MQENCTLPYSNSQPAKKSQRQDIIYNAVLVITNFQAIII
jgi:hypothetical protein